MPYYRVGVIADEDGVRPDINADFTVIQYLNDGTVVVFTEDPVAGLTELTLDEVDSLVTNPVYKVIEIDGVLYSFTNVEGTIPIGLNENKVICLRKEEEVVVPKYVDADGNPIEVMVVKRTKLIEPNFSRVIAIEDDDLVVYEKTDVGLVKPTKVDPETGEEYEDEDPEIETKDGKRIRLSDVGCVLVEKVAKKAGKHSRKYKLEPDAVERIKAEKAAKKNEILRRRRERIRRKSSESTESNPKILPVRDFRLRRR